MNKKRVAAYCRVSSDMQHQKTSIALQRQVFSEKIAQNPSWELVAIYSDEGITGTSIRKRPGFQQMMTDASEGLIDIILTKSISRFARNTLECLETIRELQSYNVQLIFEKEGIATGEAFSEMLLSIMAAFAQEESRSVSENLKWGIRKRFAQGIDRWTTIYGYTKNENGKYQIVDEEAEIVRLIYRLYDKGYSMGKIANHLNDMGVSGPEDGRWDSSNTYVILDNEKYVGDIRLQKKYTVDHIDHKEIKNDGRIPSYYIKDHHAPIVDRKLYERVQFIKEMRSRKKDSRYGGFIQYPFGDYITCPYCGSVLRKQKLLIQNGGSYLRCTNENCEGFILLASFIEKAIVNAYNSLDVSGLDENEGEEASRMIRYKKESPVITNLEYCLLDDLVSRVSLGRHSSLPMVMKMIRAKGGEIDDDRTITIYWRCGLKTTMFSGIEKDKDLPVCLLSLYRGMIKRK